MYPKLVVRITSLGGVDLLDFPYQELALDFEIGVENILVVVVDALVARAEGPATLVEFYFKAQRDDIEQEDPKPPRAFIEARQTVFRWIPIPGPHIAMWGRLKLTEIDVPGK